MIAAAVAPLMILCTLSTSDFLATRLLPALAGALTGAVVVYLLTLRRGGRRAVAAFLISSWCVALVGTTFLPAPPGAHPFFDLSEPVGCLVYGLALGFGVAAVVRWVDAGSATGRPASGGTGPRSRCHHGHVRATLGMSGRRSRCSPTRRAKGSEGAP